MKKVNQTLRSWFHRNSKRLRDIAGHFWWGLPGYFLNFMHSSASICAAVWWGLPRYFLNLIPWVTFGLIATLLYHALSERSVVIQPIAVPKLLQDSGYSPDVAATRLRDTLDRLVERAKMDSSSPVTHTPLSQSNINPT